jgi:hypothetical protein
MRAWTQDFLDEIERLTGKKPIIYTSPGFWESELGDTSMFAEYPLWVAHYGTTSPRIPGGWSRYTFWQYTQEGSVPGVTGAVDRNRFNGTIADLQALARGNPSTTLPGLSVISRAAGGLDVFAVTSDYRLKHRAYVNSKWTCWSTLPSNARIKGDPAAIAKPGRIDVFAQGTDNRLKKITWTTAAGWSDWADLGEYTITSAPAVTSRSTVGIDVFVKSTANKIVYRNYSTHTDDWATPTWTTIGDNAATITASSAPAAVANPDGTRMNVLTRAADGSLLTLMWTKAGAWYNWVDRGGNITGRPAVSTRAGNSIDVFLRDHDNSLIHRFSPDGADFTTYTPADSGGYLTTSPTSVSWNNQRIDVFSRNANADLIQRAWAGTNGWSSWSGHGPIGAPAC